MTINAVRARVAVVAAHELVRDAMVVFDGGTIVDVGPFDAIVSRHSQAALFDTTVDVLLPGFIDAHSHVRSYPCEAQDLPPDASLEQFLVELTGWTRVDAADDALVAGADLVSTGVTTVQVSYVRGGAADLYRREVEDTVRALRSRGLRVALALGFKDQHEFLPVASHEGASVVVEALARPRRAMSPDEWAQLFDELAKRRPSWLSDVILELGPMTPAWCSADVWSRVRERAVQGARVHTHLNEGRLQRSPFYGPGGMSVLDDAGVLGPMTSAAHAVWLTDDEIDRIARAGMALVHCPSSNTRLHSGVAAVRRWLDAGVVAALGFDSLAATAPVDAFVEMRMALSESGVRGEPVREHEIFAMATSGGAHALGIDAGRLAPGCHADFVGLDRVDFASSLDPVATVVNTAVRDDVAVVWVAGKPVYRRSGGVDRQVAAARSRVDAQLAEDGEGRRARLVALRSELATLRSTWLNASQE